MTACVLGLLLGLETARTCRAQCGELLANPGFEDGPGSLIPLTDSVGFWSYGPSSRQVPFVIVDTLTACSSQATVLPRTGQWFFAYTGGSSYPDPHLEQIVELPVPPPPTLTFSGWFDACGSQLIRFVADFLSSVSPGNLVTVGSTVVQSSYLDFTVASWEKVTLSCVPVPPQARYVLFAVVSPGDFMMDDASVTCDPCTVPVQPTTWGRIKSLYRN